MSRQSAEAPGRSDAETVSESPAVRLKDGVNPYGLHPRVKSAIVLVASIIHQTAGKKCVITSLGGGVHGEDSFHYLLGAFDFRTKHLTDEEREGVIERVRQSLGDGWDVVLEDVDKANEHAHCEWDEGREELTELLAEKCRAVEEELNAMLG